MKQRSGTRSEIFRIHVLNIARAFGVNELDFTLRYQFVKAVFDSEYFENVHDALKNFAKASELTQDPAPALHGRLAELYVRAGELEKALELFMVDLNFCLELDLKIAQ